ncbi:alpha/beta fold hydrolase [Cryobacterium serini]|nr:alpha/beta hydrolase [Cryobacterium serini]
MSRVRAKDTETRATEPAFALFDMFRISLAGVQISGRVSRRTTGAARPALLLLHGHPETHLIWRHIADRLAEHYTVIIPDLRGYGDSHAAVFAAGSDTTHAGHSKRAMALDQVRLMEHFGAERGFTTFAVAAHDRGARVAHRLLVDHPGAVTRALLLDIAPTVDMYDGSTRAFAEAYFHWFLLIQPYPLPEALIEANPRGYVENVIGGRYAGLAPFPTEILDAYVEALSRPGAVHSMCEDYRASATIDLHHDRADRAAGLVIETPIHLLWGRHGVIETLFDPLTLWGALASAVTGHPVDSGHYLPEEVPDEILREILAFVPALPNTTTRLIPG